MDPDLEDYWRRDPVAERQARVRVERKTRTDKFFRVTLDLPIELYTQLAKRAANDKGNGKVGVSLETYIKGALSEHVAENARKVPDPDSIEVPLPDGSGSYRIPTPEKWCADQKAKMSLPEPMRTFVVSWLEARTKKLGETARAFRIVRDRRDQEGEPVSNPYRTAEPSAPPKTDAEKEAELVEELRIATERLALEVKHGDSSSMMLRALSVIMIQGCLAAHRQMRLERKIDHLLRCAGQHEEY